MNIRIGDYGSMEAERVMSPEDAMGQFKRMKGEAAEVVSKVESFQAMATKFVDGASETLNMSISKGEEYLASVQKLVESQEVQRNPLFQALIQLMEEDLAWFKKEGARLANLKKHYDELSKL